MATTPTATPGIKERLKKGAKSAALFVPKQVLGTIWNNKMSTALALAAVLAVDGLILGNNSHPANEVLTADMQKQTDKDFEKKATGFIKDNCADGLSTQQMKTARTHAQQEISTSITSILKDTAETDTLGLTGAEYKLDPVNIQLDCPNQGEERLENTGYWPSPSTFKFRPGAKVAGTWNWGLNVSPLGENTADQLTWTPNEESNGTGLLKSRKDALTNIFTGAHRH